MKDVFDELLANPALQAVGTAILLAVVALWLAAAWWAYQDASRRMESPMAGFAAAGWIILSTPLTLPLSLAIYALARPQATASDGRAQALMARLNEIVADQPTCPGCEALVDPGWLRCPSCATWFALECAQCGEWSAAGLEICPYCGADRDTIPVGWLPADSTGQGTTAAGEPTAVGGRATGGRAKAPRLQRGRMASSWRPSRYAASRETSSASS
jgi:hypothetical protein